MLNWWKKLTGWDVAALALLALIIILIPANYFLYPSIYTDPSYHLSVANGFNRAGGIALWDFWEFAPTGRPHLYPPLLHFILALVLKTGISAVSAIKLFAALANPLLLLTFWWVTKKIVGAKIALLALLINLISFDAFVKNTVIWPAVLALILILLCYQAIYQQKKISAIIWLTLALYSHLELAHLTALSLILLSWWQPKFRALIFPVLGWSYLLYLPWAWHLLNNLAYLNSGAFPVAYSLQLWWQRLQLFLLSTGLAVVGLITTVRRKIKHQNIPEPENFLASLSVCWLISLLPVWLTYSDRFWNVLAWYPLSWLAALTLLPYLEKLQLRLQWQPISLWLPTILILLLFNPTLTPTSPGRLGLANPTFLKLLTADGSLRANVYIYNDPYNSLIEKIRTQTAPPDIIAAVTPAFGNYQSVDIMQFTVNNFFGALADRPVLAGGFLKVRKATIANLPQELAPLKQVKAVIADYTQLKQTNTLANNYFYEPLAQILQQNFTPIYQEKRLVLLVNNNAATLTSTPRGLVIPVWLVLMLLTLSGYLVWRESQKTSNTKTG